MMNEIKTTDRADVLPDFGASLAQITSNTARQFCEQNQTITQTMNEWNTEVGHFVSHRVERTGEAIGCMTKCQSLPEVLAIQTQWLHDAAEDYLKEMNKLMEANRKIMGGLLPSVGKVGTQSASETRSSPARSLMKAAS